MIVLMTLGTLGMLTATSVQSGSRTAGNERFHSIAVYAAESGGAVAIDYLRKNIDVATGWAALISPSNATIQSPTAIPGNNVVTEETGNVLSDDMVASYKIEILNNRDDSGFSTGTDADKRVVVRSTGYGPNGAVAVIEWDISGASSVGTGRPCPGYGQRGMAEDGAGRNDCLGTITNADTQTFVPGN